MRFLIVIVYEISVSNNPWNWHRYGHQLHSQMPTRMVYRGMYIQAWSHLNVVPNREQSCLSYVPLKVAL